MINPLQEVINPVEKMALEVANLFSEADPKPAQNKMKELSTSHNLTFGEANILGHIVSCMIHNKEWKK